MAEVLSNVTTVFSSFENASITPSLLFNRTRFDIETRDSVDLKAHFFPKNETVLLIKRSPSKKQPMKYKSKKFASNKVNSREDRKKSHGHGHSGGHGHGHGGGHGHDHEGGHGHGHGHGSKGCVVKYIKGGKDKEEEDDKKKYALPMMIGLVTAKAVLLPIVLKTLAIMSAKGLMLGLISIIMATILSLKKMMDNGARKHDDVKIEVVPVPIKEKSHHYEEAESSYHPYSGYY